MGHPGKLTRSRNWGIPHSAAPDRSAVWQLDAGPCDLIVKYQCIVVKHVILNLAGAIFQLQSGLFLSLGRAALRIKKKVCKAFPVRQR